MPWHLLTTVGAALVFFYGLNLEKLRAGMRNWRLPVVGQLTTVLFPVLALLAKPFFGTEDLLWQDIFFLCALPSTVSTSVVMVSIAGGNLPAAIFDASLSSLLGIAPRRCSPASFCIPARAAASSGAWPRSCCGRW